MTLRRYRVAASCFEPDTTQQIDQRREALRIHLTELLKQQCPNLVVLPEMVVLTDFDRQDRCGAEPADGPTVRMVSEIARSFSANICVPIIEDDGGTLYNAAIYVDRRGHIAGKYRKHVPTSMELEHGIRPGGCTHEPVIMDGLRVGTAICFDENYPDLIWNWIASGVDLLIFPSYTYGGKLMCNWAINCGVPLVCAFPWESVIYDRDGSILVEAGTQTATVRFGNHPAWIACNLNFQSRVYHLDGNQARLKEIAARYGGKVDVRLMVREGRVMITATSDGVDIDQIEQEAGLVSLRDYLRESRVRAEEARMGQTGKDEKRA